MAKAAMQKGKCENCKNISSDTGYVTGVTDQESHICNMEDQKSMYF